MHTCTYHSHTFMYTHIHLIYVYRFRDHACMRIDSTIFQQRYMSDLSWHLLAKLLQTCLMYDLFPGSPLFYDMKAPDTHTPPYFHAASFPFWFLSPTSRQQHCLRCSWAVGQFGSWGNQERFNFEGPAAELQCQCQCDDKEIIYGREREARKNMILSAQLSNDGQHESDEDDEDELMKHMTFEERIAHIKHRTRPEMSSEVSEHIHIYMYEHICEYIHV